MNTHKHAAFKAWNTGKCSDVELEICILSLRDMIDTMDAMGLHGVFMVGFITSLHSMESAMAERKRDRS